MREHVIYYFSGTGNSLKTALTIQKAQGNCELISMGSSPAQLDAVSSLGFVFPCYFGGVPRRVLEFITEMKFTGSKPAYVYVVVTYGALVSSTLEQFNTALKAQGVELSYAASLKAFSNYVILYDMSDKASEKLAQTKTHLQPIIADILERKTLKVANPNALLKAYNRFASRDVRTQDANFVVQETCTQCGICEQVCPVKNIELVEGKPHWLGHCEQCLACLQWCPERAIDFGKKTQNRGRYTNPEITCKMFISHLAGVDTGGRVGSPAISQPNTQNAK